MWVIIIFILLRDKQNPQRLVWNCGGQMNLFEVSVCGALSPRSLLRDAGFWVTAQGVLGHEFWSPVLPCFAVSEKLTVLSELSPAVCCTVSDG